LPPWRNSEVLCAFLAQIGHVAFSLLLQPCRWLRAHLHCCYLLDTREEVEFNFSLPFGTWLEHRQMAGDWLPFLTLRNLIYWYVGEWEWLGRLTFHSRIFCLKYKHWLLYLKCSGSWNLKNFSLLAIQTLV
jgi:hypothetical protein